MSYASEANKRYWKRVECEFFGIPVPDWAKLKRRGRLPHTTIEERAQYKKEYNHRYYLEHRGAGVKRPLPGRTKRPVAITQEERRMRNREHAKAWQRRNKDKMREKRRRRMARIKADPERWSAFKAKRNAWHAAYLKRRRLRDPEFAQRQREYWRMYQRKRKRKSKRTK